MSSEEINELETRVKQNDARAMNELSEILEKGEEVPADLRRAKELLEKSAELNYPDAMTKLAVRIYYKENMKAKYLLLKAAEMGFGRAFYAMATFETDEDKKLYYYVRAADSGYILGNFSAGVMYFNSGDMENAFKYFKSGADRGEINCCHFAMLLCLTGKRKNLDDALKYAKKCYESGNDVQNNYVYLSIWKIISTEYRTPKEIKFLTNKEGEYGTFFTTAVPDASDEIDIYNRMLLIYDPNYKDASLSAEENNGKTESIKYLDFMDVLSFSTDHRDGRMTLKEIHPDKKNAKYIVSIFHALEDKLGVFE